LSATIVGVVIYVPLFQHLFDTVALSLLELMTIIVLASSGYIIIEITKALQRVD
jgi:hypothetical protein